MKEAKLALRDGEGDISRHVTVKLTGDHLILKEIPNSRQLINSTSIGSSQKGNSLPPYSPVDVKPLNKRMPSEAMQAAPVRNSEERVVTIKRQPGGGLGISVKGGAEHGIPVLISRVFPGQAADHTNLLHPGDAILAVNSKRVDQMLHDDVVAELKTCGPDVSLTVRAFDGAGHVLHPPAAAATAAASDK